MRSLLAAAAVAALLAHNAPVASGQETTAKCDKSFDWANNTAGDSPCAVGSALLAVCSDTHTWVVPKLAPKNTYRGPNSTEANRCQCSTVTYSLLAACSLCQKSNPISFTKWSEECRETDISISEFPFTNSTKEIPLWARGPLTSSKQFDLKGAKRIAGVGGSDGWPVRDIVLISFGIAAAFFLIFLAIYFYIRRHRVLKWIGKRRSKGKYAPIDPSQKHGRVRSAAPGVYALDLDARRTPESSEVQYFHNQSSSYNSNTQRSYNSNTTRSNNSNQGGMYDDPFNQRFQAQHHRNVSNSNDNGNSTPYGDTKPYAGVSSSSLATTASSQRPAVQYSDNLLKHPEARSTVNVLPAHATPPPGAAPSSSTPPVRPRRDDTTVYNFSSLASPLSPPDAPYRQQLPISPPANQTEFGHHPAHERNASSSSLNLARPVHLQHSKTPSGSSMRGYEPGPSAPLFSRTKQVANRRKDTAFSIDGRSESGSSSYSIVSPPTPTGADGGLNRLRAGHLDAHHGPSSDGSTLVHSGPAAQVPRVQVTAPSTTSGTLVSQHGRIENASHYGEIEDASSEAYQHYPGPRNASSPRWEEAPRAQGTSGGLKPQQDERDPFATLRSLSLASEPDLLFDRDSSDGGHATPRRRRDPPRDAFSDDPRR
ncbi:hypothetical protein AURDEDRAFT_152914 [Auricularia subglabra TFB-10046 SS5]|nr:hypothetical protein AURDEDRAFT_152914 [Auricularia subglabra TFB-10046 SS5]